MSWFWFIPYKLCDLKCANWHMREWLAQCCWSCSVKSEQTKYVKLRHLCLEYIAWIPVARHLRGIFYTMHSYSLSVSVQTVYPSFWFIFHIGKQCHSLTEGWFPSWVAPHDPFCNGYVDGGRPQTHVLLWFCLLRVSRLGRSFRSSKMS
jgi:hypothetical protein